MNLNNKTNPILFFEVATIRESIQVKVILAVMK